MKLQIYERLSAVYDLDWGNWSHQYVDLVKEHLRQAVLTNTKIIDVACGTGSLALELVKLGHSVLGLDISPNMIEVAKSKAADLTAVNFQVADMRNFSVGEMFDCALCTFDALNYLKDIYEVQEAFESVTRVLNPGGFFIFDFITEELFLHRARGTYKRKLGGIPFVQKLQYYPKRRVATTNFEFPNGIKEHHIQVPYDLKEIEDALNRSGFNLYQALSGFGKEPYNEQSERFICFAKKRADVA
jgi:ubiquinone/menaquinone biosynthesis C-methylase UbiE